MGMGSGLEDARGWWQALMVCLFFSPIWLGIGIMLGILAWQDHGYPHGVGLLILTTGLFAGCIYGVFCTGYVPEYEMSAEERLERRWGVTLGD